MVKITRLSLFIINNVRFRRLILGYSTRKLSDLLNNSEGYVGMVESSVIDSQYPTYEWPELAKALKCDVHDLLPPDGDDHKNTGDLVDKVILDLRNIDDMRLIIEGLISNGYFEQPRSLIDTAKYLYTMNESEQVAAMTAVIEEFSKAGKLHNEGDLFKTE